MLPKKEVCTLLSMYSSILTMPITLPSPQNATVCKHLLAIAMVPRVAPLLSGVCRVDKQQGVVG